MEQTTPIATAYRSAVIYVFSGTGNTMIAAKALEACLQKEDWHTTIYQIHHGEPASQCKEIPDPNAFDIACFAYPIHAFNAPRFFLQFVKSLPALTPDHAGMPAYIFKTSGEPFRPNRASSFSLCRILRKKGFRPVSDMHMLMPYNIIFRYPDAMAKQMYLHTTEVMAKRLADGISAGRTKPPHFNPLRVCFAYLLRLQWFGAWINGPLIHADPEACTGCGKCAAECPSQNIKMQTAASASSKQCPSFGRHCIMCMRCVMYCPSDAIKPGFLNHWKVSPAWNFKKLLRDDSIPSDWTGSSNPGYFRLFRRYYSENK